MSATTTTNGASLEDCLTNIFSLIDLDGLRWKRFKLKEIQTSNSFIHANPSTAASSFNTPLDTHPILTTYAKCLEENHIASWRFEPQKRHHHTSSQQQQNHGGSSSHHQHGGGSLSSSNFPTPTRNSNNNTPTSAGPTNNPHTNNNNNNNNSTSNNPNSNLELWIFGYGHQLKVDNVIGEDLVEVEDDTWESKGLSYECRTLLFKALHNLIERSLISKGYTKLGRWFVQPSRTNLNNSNTQDTVFPNLDDNQNLSNHLLQTILEQQQQSQYQYNSKASAATNSLLLPDNHHQASNNASSIQQHSTSTNPNSKLNLSFSFSFFVHGDSTVCTSIDVRHHPTINTLTRQDLNNFQEGGLVRVILAPYGLNGILNGISYKDNDNTVSTSTFIRQWSKFFPLPETMSRLFPGNSSASAMTKAATSATSAGATTSTSAATSNLFNSHQLDDNGLPTRSYLSNLTNMLASPPPHGHKSIAGHQLFNANYDLNCDMIPPIVEVIVAGQRMRYPTECVFTASKFVDPYRSICNPTTPRTKVTSFSNKRPNRSSCLSKPKPLLSHKLSEDRFDSHLGLKIKSEPDESKSVQQHQLAVTNNSPFKLARIRGQDGRTFTQAPSNYVMNKPGGDKNSNPFNKSSNNNSSTANANTISRYTNSKVSSTALGPNDLVKIYPTPPSLEQNILSPHNPDEMGVINNNNNNSSTNNSLSINGASIVNPQELSKFDDIDVYKPVECFVMQPPPKWAALTNIIIPNSKTLPPQCIYKASTQKTTSSITTTISDYKIKSSILDNQHHHLKTSTSTTTIASKSIYSPLTPNNNHQHNSLSTTTTTNSAKLLGNNRVNHLSLSSPLPLKDQTNKNEFNRSPTKSIGLSLLDNNNAISASSITSTPSTTINNLNTHHQGSVLTSAATSTFSTFSMPHQILFNNIVEVSSIQFNLMLSDSVVSMILDHNFESCTLCVCNMSIKGSHYDMIAQKSDSNKLNMNNNQNNINHSNNKPNNNNTSINNNNNLNSSMNDMATNEYVNECTCGFSATVTRHCSHLSGLFYEDELELTNLLYDPTEMIDQNKLFRKVRLSSYNESCFSEEKKLITKLFPETAQIAKEDQNVGGGGGGSKASSGPKETLSSALDSLNITDEDTKITIIDQLKQQCATSIDSNSSLSKVLLTEALRNNRHLTSCINYASQITSRSSSGSSLQSCILDENSRYTTVKVLHRNPVSLKYTDLCEVTRNILNKIVSPPHMLSHQHNATTRNPIVKPLGSSSMQGSGIAAIFSSMIGASRSPILDKSSDFGSRNNIFIQGLQPLILPTLTIDPKGALQILEHLLKEESKHALATLNRAILIFASPLHDWQFLTTPTPENNFDVANMLKSLQPVLFKAVGTPNKLWKDYVHQQQQHIFSSRDSPTGAPTVPTPPCQGPLTWRQFHLAAGSDSEDHHEPQPIPSILVGHQVEKSHLALSPFALKFWDKLLLEPYAPGHNIYYLVIGPNIKDIPCDNHYKTFFKELSNMYELMKLGKHTPIGTGILLADPVETTSGAQQSAEGQQSVGEQSATSSNNNNNDDFGMFHKLNLLEKHISRNIIAQIKSYYAKLDSNLAKAIVEFLDERQPPYDPHEDRFESSSNVANRPVCGMSSRVAGSQRLNNQAANQAPVTTYRSMFKTLFGQQIRQVQLQHQQMQQQQQLQQQQQAAQQQQQQAQQHHYSSQSQHMMDQHHAYDSVLGHLSSLGGGGGSLMDSQQQHHGLLSGLQSDGSSLLNSSGSSSMMKSQSLLGGVSSSSSHLANQMDDPANSEEDTNKQTGLVIYMIDPFTSPSLNPNLRVPAIMGLIKCYTELLEHLPEHVRRITQLQLISLDSLICHSRPVADISRLDQLKSLSMNVFARCKRVLTNQITAKSLTGFGPAAALENFFKTKKADLCISRVFTPPFILAPTKDKQTELGEMFGDRREKSSVLFCSYCITEDQRWLLASLTNDRGEMSESAVININISERTKRPKASIKRLALRKLMEFIISVMSEWMNPWRLIIGKLGRLGHGELKEWANLLSKTSLLNYSRHLVTKCGQCNILPATETVSILSACLVSLEPDSKLRVMPDQFTNDDRQASFNKCPLSTPEDASATHILVFPTSASIQSTQGIVEDPLVGSGLDDDLLNQFPLDDGIEDLGVEGGMDDLFGVWPDNDQADIGGLNSHHGDGTMMSTSGNMMAMSGSGLPGQHGHMLDQTAQLLQQPLALGYYISTAKLGPMPNWFWATSSHLRNASPVFLKSALHIHMPCVQLSDDLLHSSVGMGKKSHQLDSNLTTDVLRYVLEGYNSLSWLSLHSKTYDRHSCLPVHMQNLLQLYYMMESFS